MSKPTNLEQLIKIVILVALMYFLYWLFCSASPKSITPVPVDPETVQLIGVAEISLYTLTIKNLDSQTWGNPEITIYCGMFGSWIGRAESIPPNCVREYNLMSFTDSSGNRFQPLEKKPTMITVEATIGGKKGSVGWKF